MKAKWLRGKRCHVGKGDAFHVVYDKFSEDTK